MIVQELGRHHVGTLGMRSLEPGHCRIAKLFGHAPLFWIRMQGACDAWHASREVNVSAVPTLGANAVNAATA